MINNGSYSDNVLWKMNITTYNDNFEDDPFTVMTPTWSDSVWCGSNLNNFATMGSIVYSSGFANLYLFDMTSQQISTYSSPLEYSEYPCFVHMPPL